MQLKRGLEPPRGCPHMTLNHARLPIPPLRQRSEQNIEAFAVSCNAKSRLPSGISTVLGYTQLYGCSGPIRWACRLLAAFDLHLDRIVDADEVLDMGEKVRADEDLATTSMGLQALRHVDHIAHHRIFHALLGTNIAHDSFAAVDVDAQVQCGLTTAQTARAP